MISRRSFVATGSAAAAAGFIARPDAAHAAALASGRLRFLTNWYAQAEHGGYYQALATGLYRRAGLEVEIEPGGPQVNNAQLLVAGAADLAIYADFGILEGIQRGLPLVMLASSFQFDPLGILVHDDVTSLAGLKGHRVLISGAEQPVVWPLLMRRFGLDPEQLGPYAFNLQPFFVDPTLAIQSYATSEPFEVARRGMKFRMLLLRDAGFPSYGNPIATRRDLLAEHPDLLRAFLTASMQGWKDYLVDPAPANRLILAANPRMTEERMAFAVAEMRRLGLVTGGDAARGGIGIMTEARWKQDADFLRGLGMVPAGLDWRRAFDLGPISAAPVLPA